MRILKKPKLIASVLLVFDVILLVAALVLDSLRGRFDTAYALADDGSITASHPLDIFGIAVAIALFVAAVLIVLFAMAVISNRRGNKMAQGIAGCVVLAVFSVGVIIFSYFWVRGAKPIETTSRIYTDQTAELIFSEDKYADDYGELKIFLYNSSTGELALLVATDITQFSESDDHFLIDWVMDNVLRVRFPDGDSYRSLQLDLNKILTEEQLARLLSQTEEHDHEHEHEHE